VIFHGGFGGWIFIPGSEYVALAIGADQQGRYNAIVVSIPDEITQRKDAKNAKLYKITLKKTGISPAMNQILFFVNYLCELCELCELCVFAVKTVFRIKTV
jgi:hypothetical protein